MNDTQNNGDSGPDETDAQQADLTGGNFSADGTDADLLQSASIDLDGDGINETIRAVRKVLPATESGAADEQEGWLLINSGTEQRRICFCKKPENDASGIMTEWQFEDLDGDGTKDVFIAIPGYGASFSYSNCFIYSYKKDLQYTFTRDNELEDFINGFEPKYTRGGNKLTLINRRYNFSADIAIDSVNDDTPDEETMLYYASKMWIEPVAVNIDEESKISVVKGADNKPEIKIPLPIFGMATVDMIGEIDLYYSIDKSFNPVLKRFEILDFTDKGKIKAGSCDVQ